VVDALTEERGPDELFQHWRNFQNLPAFMTLLESVEVIDPRRSRWRLEGPRGKSLEWETEITQERPGELIAWRALEGAPLPNSGEVRFRRAPGGRGTEVVLTIEVQPPSGVRGAVARLLKAVPGFQVENDLRRFKQLMEVGEVVASDSSVHLGPHPARPPTDDEIG